MTLENGIYSSVSSNYIRTVANNSPRTKFGQEKQIREERTIKRVRRVKGRAVRNLDRGNINVVSVGVPASPKYSTVKFGIRDHCGNLKLDYFEFS